jgi:hypothetical protein
MSFRTHTGKPVARAADGAARFGRPARAFPAPVAATEAPDPKVQMERAERLGHRFPSAAHGSGASLSDTGTSSPDAPIQLRGNNGRRRRRRAKQWKAQKRAWKAQEAQPEAEQDADDVSSEPEEADPDDIAWDKSVAATADILPATHAPVKKETNYGPDGPEAITSFSHGAGNRKINVGYNPDVPSGRYHRRIGQLSQTFTHELAAHGKNLGNKEADEEHSEMHAPDTRKEYLAASHQTFRRLDNEPQKRAFAKSWHSDMNNQISWDENLGKGEKRARRDWVLKRRNSMVDAIKRPEKHAWAEEDG